MLFKKITTFFLSVKNRVYGNLGLVNLFGKSVGKLLFLGLLAYLAYVMPVQDFADFAIFWATLRLFSFYGANNLYIIYFNKIRTSVINERKWPREVSSNILVTFLLFSLLLLPLSYIIFKEYSLAILLYISSFLFMLVRHLAEFSKINNNLFLSILIEDVLFNVLFFILCLFVLQFSNTIFSVVLATFLSLLLVVGIGILLFVKKFRMRIPLKLPGVGDFSRKDFLSGLNYSILRGHEVLSNFAVRYLGKIFYGSLFVAYSHVLFQFYNIFTILTISVVSGFQSKTTIKEDEEFDNTFIKKSYRMMIKPLLPFILVLVGALTFFGRQVLAVLFPKFVAYDYMLYWICIAGLIFALIQPFVFILIYNNKFKGIKRTNTAQYITLGIVLIAPIFGIHQDVWLIALMSTFILLQGMLAFIFRKNS